MEKTIDLDLFNKNPKLFIELLPEKAKEEYINMLEYIIFKYNINQVYATKKSIFNKSDFSFHESLELTKEIKGSLSEFVINERRDEKW